MKKRILKKLFVKLNKTRCNIFLKIRLRETINCLFYKKIKWETKELSKYLNICLKVEKRNKKYFNIYLKTKKWQNEEQKKVMN